MLNDKQVGGNPCSFVHGFRLFSTEQISDYYSRRPGKRLPSRNTAPADAGRRELVLKWLTTASIHSSVICDLPPLLSPTQRPLSFKQTWVRSALWHSVTEQCRGWRGCQDGNFHFTGCFPHLYIADSSPNTVFLLNFFPIVVFFLDVHVDQSLQLTLVLCLLRMHSRF